MERKIPCCIVLALAVTFPVAANVTDMRCEYRVDPIGIDVSSPRLTWEYDGKNDFPSSCQVEMSESSKFEKSRLFYCKDRWTANVTIDNTPGKRYYWRVIQTLAEGCVLKSGTATFETGRFSHTQWSASWISDSFDINKEEAQMFRKAFKVNKKPRNARIYVSSLGYYDMYLNGKRVGINLDPENPGFSHIVIRPAFMDGLDRAEGSYNNVKGLVSSRWERKTDGTIELDITVPYGATATVQLKGRTKMVQGGHHKFKI